MPEKKDNKQERIYELLKRGLKMVESGEELPAEWSRELFPPERKEYELVYAGKETQEEIIAGTMAVPLQPVSTFGQSGVAWHNALIFGDNLQAMKTLLEMKERGELVNADGTSGVKLIYIDPPFATKKEFRGTQDQKAYQDKMAGAEFLEFLRKRLVLMKELLADNGSIYLHLDWKKGHYAKVLMDEIFGENNFVREIIWDRMNPSGGKAAADNWIHTHDVIYFYSKRSKKVFNKQYEPYSQKYIDERFVYEDKKGKYRLQGDNRKQYLHESKGKALTSVWSISDINVMALEKTGFPTQKPEVLLERIIKASSNKGDIVLDAFAGSGTTCAVAEKLDRRWISIDVGKLAIYTIQKRLLNLKSDVGNLGAPVKIQPFTLYNAGLYDFDTLRQLPWESWRFFALQLFECKDEPHQIHGFKMDGKRQGSSVLVFNHFNKGTISRDTITDLHASIGKVVGDRCFIIAPRGAFLFQEDYIEIDNVRYYALRIPYSYINELHRREFSAIKQPNDATSVNETVEAVGFDFIQPPIVELDFSVNKNNVAIKIKKFESRARVRGEEKVSKHDALSMVMIDFDYNDKVFDLDRVIYAGELKSKKWKMELPFTEIKKSLMLVFLDIYGNESRMVVEKQRLQRISGTKKK